MLGLESTKEENVNPVAPIETLDEFDALTIPYKAKYVLSFGKFDRKLPWVLFAFD